MQRCSPSELNTWLQLQPSGAVVDHEHVPVRVGGERFDVRELAVLLFALAAELALEVALAVEDLDTVVAFVGNRHL